MLAGDLAEFRPVRSEFRKPAPIWHAMCNLIDFGRQTYFDWQPVKQANNHRGIAMNQQTVQGNWDQIKGSLQQKWGQLTNDDLMNVQGSLEQLKGMLVEKTGETREAINSYLDSIGGSQMIENAMTSVRQYASNAAEHSQEIADEAMKQVKAGYVQTSRMVQQKPVESLAVCFGVGILTGVVAGLMVTVALNSL